MKSLFLTIILTALCQIASAEVRVYQGSVRESGVLFEDYATSNVYRSTTSITVYLISSDEGYDVNGGSTDVMITAQKNASGVKQYFTYSSTNMLQYGYGGSTNSKSVGNLQIGLRPATSFVGSNLSGRLRSAKLADHFYSTFGISQYQSHSGSLRYMSNMIYSTHTSATNAIIALLVSRGYVDGRAG